MGTANRNRPTRSLHRSLPTCAVVVGALGIALLVVGSPTAQAASRSGLSTGFRHVAAGAAAARTSSLCDKVSAASVSAIIGYKVPAPTSDTLTIKPEKENFEISGTDTVCTYGPETSMATILKAVSLSYEVISKPLTSAEMQESIKRASVNATFKFTTYPGLGVPGFYFSLTEAGITGQGISGVLGGTRYFGATVENKNVSKTTLANLAKLAEKL